MVVTVGSILAALFVHTIAVEPYLGQTGAGAELFGPAVTVPCFVDEKVRRVRTPSADTSVGDEVLSEATAYAALATVAPAGSRVTLPTGRRAFVLQALRRDGGSLPVPSHLEIVIT